MSAVPVDSIDASATPSCEPDGSVGPLLFRPIAGASERRAAFDFARGLGSQADGASHRFAGADDFQRWLRDGGRSRAYLLFVDGRMLGWYAVRQLNARAGYQSTAELYLEAGPSSRPSAVDRVVLHAATAARAMGFDCLVFGSSAVAVDHVAASLGRVAGSVGPVHVLQLDLSSVAASR